MSSISCSLLHCAFDSILCVVSYCINFYSAEDILINTKKIIKQKKKSVCFWKKKFVNNFQDLLAASNQEKLLDLYWLFSHSLVYVLINGVIKILLYQRLYFQYCNISLVWLCYLASWVVRENKPGEDAESTGTSAVFPFSTVSGLCKVFCRWQRQGLGQWSTACCRRWSGPLPCSFCSLEDFGISFMVFDIQGGVSHRACVLSTIHTGMCQTLQKCTEAPKLRCLHVGPGFSSWHVLEIIKPLKKPMTATGG